MTLFRNYQKVLKVHVIAVFGKNILNKLAVYLSHL